MNYRLEHSLHNQVYIRLDKVQAEEKVSAPWAKFIKTGAKTSTELFEDVPIEQVYDATVGQRFLILGAPGSGKTTTLLNLAKVLVERAEADNTEKIPVLLNLSSWKKDDQSIREWILDNLKFKYGIRRDIGEKWLDEKVILPLLDGLDELEAARQDLCIQKVNEFLSDFWQVGEVVVCSRTEEYELQQSRFVLNGAIVLQPLTEAKIKDFIRRTEGEVLWESVRSDADILALAKKPLFLDVIVLAWQEISFEEWQKLETSEARQAYLWEAYITRMLAQNNRNHSPTESKTKTRYADHKALHWLRWLAWQLTRLKQTEFFIEYLQPYYLFKKQILTYKLMLGVIHGGIFGLIVSLITIVNFRLFEPAFVVIGFVLGQILGFVVGVPTGLFFEKVTLSIKPIETISFSMKKSLAGLLAGGSSGLFVGGIIGLSFGAIQSLVFGLLFGLLLGLTGALVAGFQGASINIKRQPNEGMICTLKYALIIIPVGLLITGMICQLWYLVEFSSTSNIFPFLVLSGVFSSIFLATLSLLQHLVLRLTLFVNVFIPWDYGAFLDYCTDRLFLQRVGGGYRFIHRNLQEHLAAQYEASLQSK